MPRCSRWGAYITVIVANATGSVGLGFIAAIMVTRCSAWRIYVCCTSRC